MTEKRYRTMNQMNSRKQMKPEPKSSPRRSTPAGVTSRQPTRARVSAFLHPGREPYPKGIKAHVGACVAKCETANSQCRGCAYILGQTPIVTKCSIIRTYSRIQVPKRKCQYQKVDCTVQQFPAHAVCSLTNAVQGSFSSRCTREA